MIEISLMQIPNQSFSIRLDESWFNVRINSMDNGACVVSIDRDNVTVISGVRAMPNSPLIPYQYLEGTAGNFAFVTRNGEYPTYTEFGVSQALIYASAEEIAAIRNGQ